MSSLRQRSALLSSLLLCTGIARSAWAGEPPQTAGQESTETATVATDSPPATPPEGPEGAAPAVDSAPSSPAPTPAPAPVPPPSSGAQEAGSTQSPDTFATWLLPTALDVAGAAPLKGQGAGEFTPDGRARAVARRLDAIMPDALADLGLHVDTNPRPGAAASPDEAELLELGADHWVIAPLIRLRDDELVLVIRTVSPHSRVVISRADIVRPGQLEVRAMVLTHQAVEAHAQAAPAASRDESEQQQGEAHSRSSGRAVLAISMGALGGYTGWTLQRTSGSSDARLTYPMVAVGAGFALGASLVAAEEWDITDGGAWYLAAGTRWPATAGYLLAAGSDVHPTEDRHAYALVGAMAGTTLATVGLVLTDADAGDAALAHSGGAGGLLLGSIVEMAYEGDTSHEPRRGAGLGAALGVVGAGLASTWVKVEPSRVVMVDAAAGLGALGGAALASPLLFASEGTVSHARQRGWLAAVGAGMVLGAGTGLWLTSEPPSEHLSAPPKRAAALNRWAPYAGIVGASSTPRGEVPAWGAGVTGLW